MKILLSGVFGPYGVDDKFGRKENVMELFHNQVTREQGLFSLRYHHPSFGLYFIAENINTPTVVLDFPSQKDFIREIKKGYDYVGISFIAPNFIKAKHMAKLVRQYAPNSKIILGGHGTPIPDIEKLIDHDYICRGEGVGFMRKLLKEDTKRPYKHPAIGSASFKRIMGLPVQTDSAVLIPGVGCPNACRFCATSHFFDKKYTAFFDSGKELFDTCVEIEKKIGCKEFFVMDENFLKRPERAREFVELMEQHNKPYSFGIFSSAETIANVGVEFLARLGVRFLWMGVESKREIYEKNKGIDIKKMIAEIRDHGISVLASGILFLEHHDKQSIHEDIEFMVDLGSDLVQFMALSPIPGTALFEDYREKNILCEDMPYEERHGQDQIWFKHPFFSGPETSEYLRDAFKYDYDMQGPSLLRMADTLLRGSINLAKYQHDSFMKIRHQQIEGAAKEIRHLLPAIIKYAHNDRTRELAVKCADAFNIHFGLMTLKEKAFVEIIKVMAARELKRIAFGRQMYQPKKRLTRYRMSRKDLVKDSLKGRSLKNILNIDLDFQHDETLVYLSGVMDRVNSKKALTKFKTHIKKDGSNLVIDLNESLEVEGEALHRLLAKIARHHEKIKLVYNENVQSLRSVIASLPDELSNLFVEQVTAEA